MLNRNSALLNQVIHISDILIRFICFLTRCTTTCKLIAAFSINERKTCRLGRFLEFDPKWIDCFFAYLSEKPFEFQSRNISFHLKTEVISNYAPSCFSSELAWSGKEGQEEQSGRWARHIPRLHLDRTIKIRLTLE